MKFILKVQFRKSAFDLGLSGIIYIFKCKTNYT